MSPFLGPRMSYLLRNAGLITLKPAEIECADLRIEAGFITDRGTRLEPGAEDELIDLDGKIVMPGLVCAHTHLYSALARGMPAPPRAPANFREILEMVWWRLDRALDEETLYWSALAGAADAARAGTTCLYDHHSSPTRIRGSLETVREALENIGLRAVLCYEVTDRGGREERDAGVAENRAFLERTAEVKGLFRALVGAHASFTLSASSLQACAELMQAYDTGLHIHAAEDLCDEEDAHSNYGIGVAHRLEASGCLNGRTILAHGTHLDEKEIGIARQAGVWFAHNPRSNMNNRVGYAPVSRFGDRLVLGTDGIGADMFDEARFAFFKAREMNPDLGADHWVRALGSTQEMASRQFGVDLARLRPGSAADLVVLDYRSPTPITAGNLAWHFLFGMSSACVESVMVAGRFVVRNRQPTFGVRDIYEKARQASQKLWAKL